MPTVIINDVAMEAQLGERLLDVARRNAAHIGFFCDGNGACLTCACRVISGADQLNTPTNAEHNWYPEARLQEGVRLGCQAALRGPGPVQVITRVEELRRQTLALVNPPNGSASTDHLRPWVESMIELNVDQLRRFPLNLIETFARLGPVRFFIPWTEFGRWVGDAARITGRMTASPRMIDDEA